MSLALFSYECQCGHRFEDWELPGHPYAIALARSDISNQMVFFNPIADPVFEQIIAMVKELRLPDQLPPGAAGDLAIHVLNSVGDLAPDGSHYLIGVHPKCPRCGSREMASWDEAETHTYRQLDLPLLPHEKWDRMTLAEQTEAVKALLPL